jgi:hypothetical protein
MEKREPKVHTWEVDSSTFIKLAKGQRNAMLWKGNGVQMGDYVMAVEKDEDELTGRHRMGTVTDVQRADAAGERGIAKGWALLNVLMFRRPRTI